MKKAQISLEYILLFGFSLFVISILWLVSSQNVQDTKWELQRAYAENALERITQTADIAYVQGSPTQIYINADFPDNVNATYIIGNAVIMELWWKGFLRNVTSNSVTNLTGYISTSRGRHVLLVKAGNIVNITES